jgi:hypothetical protein
MVISLMRSHAQKIALEPERHGRDRIHDNIACFGNVHILDGLAV